VTPGARPGAAAEAQKNAVSGTRLAEAAVAQEGVTPETRLAEVAVAQEAVAPGTRPGGGVEAQRPPGCRTHDPFSPSQRQRLEAQVASLHGNRILLRERRTLLLPADPSSAMFVQALDDPLTGQPRGIAWRVLDRSGATLEARTWIAAGAAEGAAIGRAFFEAFRAAWRCGLETGQPHLFHFGARAWQRLQVWDEAGTLSCLEAPGAPHRTDLREVLLEHFDLPAPGTLTLWAAGALLGLEPALPMPESLLHSDEVSIVPPGAWTAQVEVREEARARLEDRLELMVGVRRWLEGCVEPERPAAPGEITGVTAAGQAWLRFLTGERRLRELDVLSLQALSLEERVEQFRSLGPLTFAEAVLDEEGCFVYVFRAGPEVGLTKFREGDFLKLAPVGTTDLQSGLPVILVDVDPLAGRVCVRSRRGRLPLNRQIAWSLEEDLTDWNGPKLEHAVRTVFSSERPHPLARLLAGRPDVVSPDVVAPDRVGPDRVGPDRVGPDGCPAGTWSDAQHQRPLEDDPWIDAWLRTWAPITGLNPTQRRALELPFRRPLSLIEGPPGTGKTHLLAWTLIALIQEARALGIPRRIVVSALTHQAIDQVLRKVVALAGQHRLRDFPARCLKVGRWTEKLAGEAAPHGAKNAAPHGAKNAAPHGVETAAQGGTGGEAADGGSSPVGSLVDPGQLEALPYAIVGATGFGLYQLFDGQKGAFPPVFDVVVFDEASQVLMPQALLSLLYGRGRYLFYGDVKQLPPIVLGRYGEEEAAQGVPRSILEHLLDRYREAGIRLDTTYRMNGTICAFPSRTWYDGALRPAEANARARLELPGPRPGDLLDRLLDPDLPVALLLVDHQGCHQKSDLEIEVVTALAARLILEHGLSADQLALISPHRAQNNATAIRLEARLAESMAAGERLEGRRSEGAAAGERLEGRRSEGAAAGERPRAGSGRPDATSDVPSQATGGDVLLPLIDTVERVQGAERDVIVYALTTSDPDHLEGGFLNNPNRFNVALTRARKKLIVVGSRAFFHQVPGTAEGLRANACFKAFLEFCRERGAVFEGGTGD
jgi:hypothetical protein